MSDNTEELDQTEEADNEMSVELDTEFLSMSDDDFDNLDLASLSQKKPATSEEEDQHDEDERSEDEEDAESDDEEEEKTKEETDREEQSEETDREQEESILEDDETDQNVYDGGNETSSEVDFEAEYNKLLTPFKANGKEIKVENIDEAISLMQMGANYAKKMAGLKPNLKLMRMLEKQDLLDEGKLSYLIDLNKKDPKAIQKLIKDSEIDPLDIDTSSEEEYQPNSYSVADSEYAVTEAFQEIEDTDSYARTADIVGNKWDDSSKKVLVDNPQLIKVINNQVADGTYDKIASTVEKERMLGKLNGMSDIQAYKLVGDAMMAKGLLGNSKSNSKANKKKLIKKPNTQLKNRKRAASSTKAPAKKKVDQDFNPLAMSDDEFEELMAGRFI